MKYKIRKYSPIWWAKKTAEMAIWLAYCGIVMYLMASTYVKYGGF